MCVTYLCVHPSRLSAVWHARLAVVAMTMQLLISFPASVTSLADVFGCSNILATVALGFCMALYGWSQLKKDLEEPVSTCW